MPTINPGDNWQTITDANSPGTVFDVAAGTHLNATVVPKAGNQYIGPDPVDGAWGAILDGDDTTVKAVHEGSSNYPDDVVLRNLEVKQYNPGSQLAAVRMNGFSETGGTGWVIDVCNIHDNATVGVRLGPGGHLTDSIISANGALGISGIGDGMLVDGNEIGGNNPSGTNLGFEAGGTKFVLSDGLILRNNWSHDNQGPGLWLDIGNINYTIEDNLAEDDLQGGIFLEISYGGVVRRNRIFRAGLDDDRAATFPWGAGILVAASGGDGLEIYENIVVASVNGLAIIQQARGSNHGDAGLDPEMLAKNTYWHHNTVVMQTVSGHLNAGSLRGLEVAEDVGTNDVYDAQNNVFDANTLLIESGMSNPYHWKGYTDFSGWQSFGQDLNGRQLTHRNYYLPRER